MSLIKKLWPTLARDIVLNGLMASTLIPAQLRWRLLRAYGLAAEPSYISSKVWFGSGKVSIGRDTFINTGCMLNTAAPITIGSRCDIAMNVVFATSTHKIGPTARRAGTLSSAPIVVGDGCWIGAAAVILPGVSIGPGTVIAAGSVVTRDCAADSLYAGVPARKVRDLTKSDDGDVGSD